jgi:hypothetical protein
MINIDRRKFLTPGLTNGAIWPTPKRISPGRDRNTLVRHTKLLAYVADCSKTKLRDCLTCDLEDRGSCVRQV